MVHVSLIERGMNRFFYGPEPKRITAFLQAERVRGTGAVDVVHFLIVFLRVAIVPQIYCSGPVGDLTGVVKADELRHHSASQIVFEGAAPTQPSVGVARTILMGDL